MKILLILPALIALFACAPTPDQRGTVIAINSASVTIRGIGDYSPESLGKAWSPTPAMVAQAQEICSGAIYVSGTPVSSQDFMIDYLFKCPS